jgi:hypothetical protein
MSGGSFDYVGQKMECGEIDAFLRHATGLREALEQVLAAAQEGTLEGREKDPGSTWNTRRCPYQRRDPALIALPAVIAMFARVENQATQLIESLRDLARVGTVLDRAGSGDDGPSDVADEAINWMRKMLGMPYVNFQDLDYGRSP